MSLGYASIEFVRQFCNFLLFNTFRTIKIRNVLNSEGNMKITSLSYALLGLLSQEPKTGYALRNVFALTPMGAFSSSPGSIYPALDKLVKLALIIKTKKLANQKPMFQLTDLGRSTLVAWLSQEVAFADVAKKPELILLRFSFLESIDDRLLTIRFLTSFKTALSQHLDYLNAFMQSKEGDLLSVYGRLAMESGIEQYKTHVKWVEKAMTEFNKVSN